METQLKIYNTLINDKDVFIPISKDHITMYVCGPTVYDYAHVGNARPVVVFDTLYRLLKHIYPNRKVIYMRNITDIDDKIIDKAQELMKKSSDYNNVDEASTVITQKFQRIYEEDMAQLNAKLPDVIPKATDYVTQMIEMVSGLIEKGYAYEADGHVLFEVSKMDDYGKLSGRSVEDLIAGARVDVADYKREGADFVLWKPSTDEQPGWESPWGRGRPGWHLECSTMISGILKTIPNAKETIDIHGGGQDLIFPHHENEIAQSKCAHDGEPLAKYWMHNGYLTVDGEKMSKSLGNFITVHDQLKKHGRKAGEAIRYLLLSAHYRQPVDFSESALEMAMKRLDNWYRLTENVECELEDVSEDLMSALTNDLDTPKAISILHNLRNQIAHANDDAELLKRNLKAGANLLGMLEKSADEWFGREEGEMSIHHDDDVAAVEGVVGSLNVTLDDVTLKATGNVGQKVELGLAEEISEALPVMSNQEIDALVEERSQAKKNKDFEKADRIRDKLKEYNITLLDGPGGTTWEKK